MFSLPFLEELTSFIKVTALDDAFDALSCVATSFFFIISALLIKFGAGTKMDCWIPHHYSKAWEEFAESYCFLKDTFWYPTNEHIGELPESYILEHRLNYYQWSCVYLTFAAVVFMCPKFLWKHSLDLTDMPILYFCETAAEIDNQRPTEREEKVGEMAEILYTKLDARHSKYSMSKIRAIVVYSFIKLLYIVISLLQLLILGVFLGRDDIFWGFNLAKSRFEGITWEETGVFPRITFCEFKIHERAGHVREERIECLLGLNESNEMIYVFLWFWLVFNFAMTLLGGIYTFIFSYTNLLGHSLLITVHSNMDKGQKKQLNQFVAKILRRDGQLVLKFVKSQSDAVAQEIACKMFEIYKEKIEARSLAKADSHCEELSNGADNNADIEVNDKEKLL